MHECIAMRWSKDSEVCCFRAVSDKPFPTQATKPKFPAPSRTLADGAQRSVSQEHSVWHSPVALLLQCPHEPLPLPHLPPQLRFRPL